MKKILFLHSELATYFLACVEELSRRAEVHIIHWPINPEAPFQFSFSDQIQFYAKEDFDEGTLVSKVADINPDMIVCSGWRDPLYMKIIKRRTTGIQILSLDNPWSGNWKQVVWSLLSRFRLKPFFNYVWVAGERQKTYASKLGFEKEQILPFLYSADLSSFQAIFHEKKSIEKEEKSILYIGRYSEEKNTDFLFDAFQKFRAKHPEWTLVCMGTGPLFNKRQDFEGIKHLGFVQPEEMKYHLLRASAFVLPSLFEPWALVAHEMAACGMVLLLSDAVGAKERFLKEKENGFSFDPHSKSSLLGAFNQLADLDDEQLREFSEKSFSLSNEISPQKWASSLVDLL
ncbi:MAG: glycosyltransferase family 4 protein [Bacteroidota bacterium]